MKYAVIIRWNKKSNHYPQVHKDLLNFLVDQRLNRFDCDPDNEIFTSDSPVTLILTLQDANRAIENIRSGVDTYNIIRIDEHCHLSPYK
jgi:hypothetical protein